MCLILLVLRNAKVEEMGVENKEDTHIFLWFLWKQLLLWIITWHYVKIIKLDNNAKSLQLAGDFGTMLFWGKIRCSGGLGVFEGQGRPTLKGHQLYEMEHQSAIHSTTEGTSSCLITTGASKRALYPPSNRANRCSTLPPRTTSTLCECLPVIRSRTAILCR